MYAELRLSNLLKPKTGRRSTLYQSFHEEKGPFPGGIKRHDTDIRDVAGITRRPVSEEAKGNQSPLDPSTEGRAACLDWWYSLWETHLSNEDFALVSNWVFSVDHKRIPQRLWIHQDLRQQQPGRRHHGDRSHHPQGNRRYSSGAAGTRRLCSR